MAKYLVSWQDKQKFFLEKQRAKQFCCGVRACGFKPKIEQVETLGDRLEKAFKNMWDFSCGLVYLFFAGVIALAVIGLILFCVGVLGAMVMRFLGWSIY